MTLRFVPNLSLLWADLPLADRFEHAARAGRGEPGTGEINYRFIFDHLDRKGYDGYVGLEYRPSAGSPEESFGWLEAIGRPRGSSASR